MKRIKLESPAIKTREEMERLVGEICALTIKHDDLKISMDTHLTEVRERYEKMFAEIQPALDAKMALAQDWAEAHPSEFGKGKSVEMVHGVVGWRTGTPKLKTLSGWTWDRVMEALKSIPKFAARYIRRKDEVNKEGLLADREALRPEDLRTIGVKVVQEEAFFIQPKREELQQRLKEAA